MTRRLLTAAGAAGWTLITWAAWTWHTDQRRLNRLLGRGWRQRAEGAR
jgi:hypothetical protein